MTLAKHLQTPPVRTLMRRLRKHAPLSVPVRLRYRENIRCQGDLVPAMASYRIGLKSGKMRSCWITVDPRLPLGEKWEAIVHEWAHCLDRESRTGNLRDCHDARWGQCYSRAFRASVTFD